MTDPEPYDIERARSYWRHAPSGEGKHDTSDLSASSDEHLLTAWGSAFRSRFGGYPDEDLFLRTFARFAKGKRLLSIGSGLGFHELYYQAHGAEVTCADIVRSNLHVIERVSGLRRLGVRAFDLATSASTTFSSNESFGAPAASC